MTPHPFARIFAPLVFAGLGLLTVGMSLGPLQAEQAEVVAEAPRVERTVPAK